MDKLNLSCLPSLKGSPTKIENLISGGVGGGVENIFESNKRAGPNSSGRKINDYELTVEWRTGTLIKRCLLMKSRTTTTKTPHAVNTARRVSQCHASFSYLVSVQIVYLMFVLLWRDPV